MKTLVIGDLHLTDKEFPYTVGAVRNNSIMLENIYNHLEANPEICLVAFLGDIQQSTPEQEEIKAEWKDWFRKIGSLMSKRLSNSVKLNFRAGQNVVEDAFPIICVRGNHDNENNEYNPDDFTFFDELLKEGCIINPKSVEYTDGENKVYLDIRNYGETTRKLSPEIQKDKVTIGLIHAGIQTKTSSEKVLEMVEKYGGYPAEEVVSGLDIVLEGHIHATQPLDEHLVNETGQPCIIKVVGSLARVSTAEEEFRDYGYCIEVDTTEPQVTELIEIELPVLPYAEYFSEDKVKNKLEEIN